MKTDDAKFTAYALDELDPAERAEVEALLAGEPALHAEIDELRAFAAQLRTQLHAEEGAPLTAPQRAALLEGEPRLVAMPRVWWRRPWVQSAAAACVIVGISAAVFSRTQMRTSRPAEGGRAAGEISVQTAGLASASDSAVADFVQLTDQAADVSMPAGKPSQILALNSQGQRGGVEKADLPSAPDAFGELAPLSAAPLRADNHSVPASEPTLSTEALAANTARFGAAGPAQPDSAGVEKKMEAAVFAKRKSLTKTLSDERAKGGIAGGVPGRPADEVATLAAPARPAAPAQPTSSTAGGRDLYAGAAPAAASAALGLPAKDGSTLSIPDAYYFRGRGLAAVTNDHESRFAVPSDGVEAEVSQRKYDPLGRLREVSPHWEFSDQDISPNTEAYDTITDNAFLPVKDQPLSTFSIDVDSASYANVRRFLNENQRPPKGAVRIEELVNYFRYDYPQPDGPDPFSCALEVATCPWQTDHRLVRIGLKGKEIQREARPPSNLVFLIDVSGSMAPPNRLALVKQCLRMLVDQLTAQDTVAIAVYAGASGCVLEPTSNRAQIREALDRLDAGGSTNGAAGIQLAYDLAQRSFKKGGTNRVILCTDGDFNVGITNQSELISMIQGKAKTKIFLSVLGFGMGNLKDSTLEKLADKGNGNYAYIDTLNEGRRVFVEQMSGTLITIAKDVKVQVEFNPAQVGAYRLIGYENRLLAKEDFNDDTKDAGEIGAGHTVTALYEVVPAGKMMPQQPPGADELKYQPRLQFVPVVPGAQPAPSPAPGTPRQGDFKGEYYLLEQDSQKSGVPAGSPLPAQVITRVAPSPELLTVKLRYKQPEGDVSKKLDFPLTDAGTTWEKSSRDFRWAASVASFGLLLRDSPHKGNASWAMVEELSSEGKGDDRDGYRAEFVGLVEKAKALSR